MPRHKKPGRPRKMIRRSRRGQPGGQLSAILPLIRPLLKPVIKFIGPIIAGELLKVGVRKAVKGKKKKGKGLRLAGQRGRGVHKRRKKTLNKK